MHDHLQLADVYEIAIKIRANTPISFQMMISGLRLFGQDSILSNEELEALEQFKQSNTENPKKSLCTMTIQLNVKELVHTPDVLL